MLFIKYCSSYHEPFNKKIYKYRQIPNNVRREYNRRTIHEISIVIIDSSEFIVPSSVPPHEDCLLSWIRRNEFLGLLLETRERLRFPVNECEWHCGIWQLGQADISFRMETLRELCSRQRVMYGANEKRRCLDASERPRFHSVEPPFP